MGTAALCASVRLIRIQRAVGAIKTRQWSCFEWIPVSGLSGEMAVFAAVGAVAGAGACLPPADGPEGQDDGSKEDPQKDEVRAVHRKIPAAA